ncbi:MULTISPECIES: TetR/AcrR family transcriptional regulator [Pseudomonas]|uniref:TetR/AcrR family transcriptional regulator n=1 Tax=Pseudomonas TaxID=286 RepID=UPI001BE50235|nr:MULTISPECIES: TetR/AcrR family transcriptional regulator [Pseudomonas]MBT2337625.1 TetR/AcrR family transcriptional regulator [Pseudomonas fluorescens]MCD4530865.1 TetR/AcrR family transcriptional regulator [Pseudomonas sp. C3-2018]
MSRDKPALIDGQPKARRRLTREERLRQLLDVAWQLVSNEGTEALTLGRLAEQAGVTKPVVYDHFVSRSGLLAALYKDFDQRQTSIMDAAVEASEPTLIGRAGVIASSYVDCVLRQGREIPGVIAALASSPELEKTKREYEAIFLSKCRRIFLPYVGAGELKPASLHAMLGAAEALSNAAACDEITAEAAKEELFAVIVAMVARSAQAEVSG